MVGNPKIIPENGLSGDAERWAPDGVSAMQDRASSRSVQIAKSLIDK
jgi:hypothetical protein